MKLKKNVTKQQLIDLGLEIITFEERDRSARKVIYEYHQDFELSFVYLEIMFNTMEVSLISNFCNVPIPNLLLTMINLDYIEESDEREFEEDEEESEKVNDNE